MSGKKKKKKIAMQVDTQTKCHKLPITEFYGVLEHQKTSTLNLSGDIRQREETCNERNEKM